MSVEESFLRNDCQATINLNFRKVLRGPGRLFLVTSLLLFVASAAGTIYWSRSMPGGMPMPGGWTMSMPWMRMSGQGWLGMAISFMGMWIVMMVAMMLPSLIPLLLSYRYALRRWDEIYLGRLTMLVGAGYFFVWAVFGAAAYALGVSLAAVEMRWPALARSVPIATGVVMLLAGCVQLTAWKARQLAHCRQAPACEPPLDPDASSAWRHGLRLGVYCSLCCLGFMVILLVAGVMDLGAMAILAIAINVERFVPRPGSVARATGFVIIAAAVLMIVRAIEHMR
jgi:predicted metal-binding membrane protein